MMMGTRKSKKGDKEQNISVMDLLHGAIDQTEFVIEEKPDDFK